MIINTHIQDATKYTIHDCTGQTIPFVTHYDTDTCEIELAICLRMEKVAKDAEGELRVLESGEDHLEQATLDSPRLLMQISHTNAEGDPQMGYVFVRFTLPGSYAAFEGQKLRSEQAH